MEIILVSVCRSRTSLEFFEDVLASSVEFQLDPNQEGFPTAGRPTALVPPLLSAFVGFVTASLIMVPAVLWTKARHQKCQRERETYGHLYAQEHTSVFLLRFMLMWISHRTTQFYEPTPSLCRRLRIQRDCVRKESIPDKKVWESFLGASEAIWGPSISMPPAVGVLFYQLATFAGQGTWFMGIPVSRIWRCFLWIADLIFQIFQANHLHRCSVYIIYTYMGQHP